MAGGMIGMRSMLAAALVLAASAAAQASTVYSVAIGYGLYGHLNQSDVTALGAGAAGANSCVPTAVTNSFVHLQNQYGSVYGTTLVPTTAKAAAEDLAQNYMGTTNAAGTSGNGWIDGKYNYMEAKAAGRTGYAAQTSDGYYTGANTFVAKNTDPRWRFLYDALTAGKDIELGIVPNAAGIGHAITLSSFTWTDANDDGIIQQSEGAQIDFIDPGAPGALTYKNIWQTSLNGILNIDYGNGYTIVLAISETAVPLPTAGLAGLSLLAAIAAFARIRRRRAAADLDPPNSN